jgi:hypothetical protein
MLTRRMCSVALATLALAACSTTFGDGARPGGTRPAPRRPADRQPATAARGPALRAACGLPATQLRRLRRGYFPGRSPDIVAVPRAPNYFGGFTTYTHSGPWDYVQRVPLVLYGPGYVRRRGAVSLGEDVTVADIAPTLAELLGLEWPAARPGRPLLAALAPRRARPAPPRLVVTVVWDGGGTNVLRRWPGAWPTLRRLMREGTSILDAEVGSSPSVTPAIHATIGTGAFPEQHGIVDIPLRRAGRLVGSWDAKSPRNLRLATVGDLFDPTTDNEAEVVMLAENNWHLGMLGHGSRLEGGDRDVAVMVDEDGTLITNERYYALPPYLDDIEGFEEAVRAVDLSDGRLDSAWRGHELLDRPEEIRHTPVWARWQATLLEALVKREELGADAVPDLLFTNFKQIDLVGHDFNMLSPEVEEILRYSDDALAALVELLDRRVGRGRWVLVLTADHGQAPTPESTGAWPVAVQPLLDDLAHGLGLDAEELIEEERPGALWLHRRALVAAGGSERALAEAIVGYRLGDNVAPGRELPRAYRARASERLFAAAFPYRWMPQIWERCGPR